MKNVCTPLLLGFIILFSWGCAAQMGYTQYSINDGLKLSYKWGTAKDTNGETKKALLIRSENTNDYAVSYTYTIDMYYEGILRETTTIEDECLKAGGVSMGKLNGIYFIPQRFTEEQLESSDFNLQFNNISADKIAECVEEKDQD